MVDLLKAILRDMSLGIIYAILMVVLIVSFPILMVWHHFTKNKGEKENVGVYS